MSGRGRRPRGSRRRPRSPSGSATRPSGRPITSSSITRRPANMAGSSTRSSPSPRSPGGRRGVRLGTSVIVVPQRQAVVLAKELATLDVLSRRPGRSAGVGDRLERARVRQPRRGRPLPCRGAHTSTRRSASGATSGRARPSRSRGASTTSTDFVFEPLPVQAGGIPILVGGGSEAALRRAGRTGDGYHFSLDHGGQGRRAPGRASVPRPRRPAGRCLRCRAG